MTATMSSQVIPAVLAVGGGALLAGLLLVPFVFRSYRKRGEVGFGPALLAFGFVVYGLAILTYTRRTEHAEPVGSTRPG